jgi:hypothetical protein
VMRAYHATATPDATKAAAQFHLRFLYVYAEPDADAVCAIYVARERPLRTQRGRACVQEAERQHA